MAVPLLQGGGISEQERQKLAAEAHKAARAVGLQEIMAANENGGVTRDSLRKGNPLAVKVIPLQSLHAQDSWRRFPLPCGIKDGQRSPQSCQGIIASDESGCGVGDSLTMGNPQCCLAAELLTCKSLKHYTNCFESAYDRPDTSAVVQRMFSSKHRMACVSMVIRDNRLADEADLVLLMVAAALFPRQRCNLF